MYTFCAEHGVPCRQSGKIIVATTGREVEELEGLKAHGRDVGVEDLTMLTRGEVKAMEPHVRALAGLHSPSTGILSAHELMNACARLALSQGAVLVTGAEALGLSKVREDWEIRYRDSDGAAAARSRVVVNAAGLSAQAIMRMAGLDPESMNLRLYLVKGDYFSVDSTKRRMVGRLVYPTPRAHLVSLGIHTVLGLDGGFKLGPSATYSDTIDYTVDASNRRAFFDDVKGFLPFLEEQDLTPDMSGSGPSLRAPEKTCATSTSRMKVLPRGSSTFAALSRRG